MVSVSGNSYVSWIKSWAAWMIRRWRVPIMAAQRVGTDPGRPCAGRWIRQSSAWRCRGSCQLRAAAGGVLAAERRPVRVKQARTACSALGRVHGRVSRAEPSRSCRSGWQYSHKPSELRQLLALMAQLAALTDAVTRLREASGPSSAGQGSQESRRGVAGRLGPICPARRAADGCVAVTGDRGRRSRDWPAAAVRVRPTGTERGASSRPAPVTVCPLCAPRSTAGWGALQRAPFALSVKCLGPGFQEGPSRGPSCRNP